jgi:hypothetical protein
LLDKGERRLGIVGMGGIGKTTLAKALYDSISGNFDYTCFVREVKKFMGDNKDPDYLKGYIKKNLLRKCYRVGNDFNWDTLTGKKVLLVLDDVKRKSHVQVMLESDGFSTDSCVIVTSRDSRFLIAESYKAYFVEPLDQENSRRLFCLNAFGKEDAKKGYDWRVEQFITTCGRLPLALQVVGKYLIDETEAVWDEVLRKLKLAEPVTGTPEDELWSLLKFCYNSLAHQEQEMFLDVATCFHNRDVKTVKGAWSVCGWASPESGLKNLEDKGFVTLDPRITFEEDGTAREGHVIRMHQVLRDLGRSIACPKNKNVATHTRLCYDMASSSEFSKVRPELQYHRQIRKH